MLLSSTQSKSLSRSKGGRGWYFCDFQQHFQMSSITQCIARKLLLQCPIFTAYTNKFRRSCPTWSAKRSGKTAANVPIWTKNKTVSTNRFCYLNACNEAASRSWTLQHWHSDTLHCRLLLSRFPSIHIYCQLWLMPDTPMYSNDMLNPSAYITPVANFNFEAFSNSIVYPLALFSNGGTNRK